MMGRSHMASGALVGAGIIYLTGVDDPATSVGFVALTTVCAVLPDFDHPDATAPRWFGWPGQFLAWLIGKVFGHRGITHSVLGLAVAMVALSFVPGLPWWIGAGVVVGCAVHIVGDMLTVMGVPLLWPHPRRFRLAEMKTGGWFETALLCPLFLAGAAWLTGMTIGVI